MRSGSSNFSRSDVILELITRLKRSNQAMTTLLKEGKESLQRTAIRKPATRIERIQLGRVRSTKPSFPRVDIRGQHAHPLQQHFAMVLGGGGNSDHRRPECNADNPQHVGLLD